MRPATHPAILSTLCVGIVTGAVYAQDAVEGPLRLIISTDTTVTGSDDFSLGSAGDDSGVIATQSLDFALFSETRLQSFSARFGGIYQLGDTDAAASGYRDPYVDLTYSRESANTALDLAARYSQVELGFDRNIPLDETEFLPSDLVTDLGQLDRLRADAALEFGRAGPVGARIALSYDLRDYQNTTDTDLFDRETTGIATSLRLDLSPVLTSELSAGLNRYDAEDATNTQRDTLDIAVDTTATLNETDTLEALIGYRRIDTQETLGGFRSDTTEDGVIARLAFARQTDGGDWNVELGTEFETTGQRTTLQFGRTTSFKSGDLAATFGITDGPDGAELIGGMEYTHALPRGDFSVSLDRRVFTTSDSEDVAQTRAELGHTFDINSVSGMEFTANFIQTDNLNTGGNETNRARLAAAYRRNVTSDWALRMGVSHRYEDSGGISDRSNEFFVSIGRSFTNLW